MRGRCFTAKVESLERPLAPGSLASIAGPDSGGLDLALFHGSREGQCPPSQKMTAPFSDDEAMGAPFAYLAVGHYHAPSRLAATGGGSPGGRLAYAGSAPAGFAAQNRGPRAPRGAVAHRRATTPCRD